MFWNLYPEYIFEGEHFTVFDVYLAYLEARNEGDFHASDFGFFLHNLDGWGITENGERVWLWNH